MSRFLAALAAIAFLLNAPAFADTAGLVRGNASVQGKPTAGVAVTLRGEGTTLVTTTDARGAFVFARVPFGHYTVVAHRDGLADSAQVVDVSSTSDVTLELNIGALREIGRTQSGTTKGVGSAPVAVNTLARAQIAALPNNQSLNSVIQTVPGIVHFSYNEPVAHGFHGLTYEVDGVPLPQGTTSNFSEIIDPRSIDSLEVFTGAFPAEFGGSRQGAVVNIISHRANDIQGSQEGQFTAGVSTYGGAQTSLAEALKFGPATRVFLNLNAERSNRGIDAPTFLPQHDTSSQSNVFLRSISNLSTRDTVAFDFSNNYAAFQIPINPVLSPNDPIVNVPGTDDVQREYDRFLNIAFTHATADGTGFTQIVPWYRSDRVAYDGDLQKDVLGYDGGSANCANPPCPLDGLREDRRSEFLGLRFAQFRSYGHHAVKAGLEGLVENFRGTTLIRQPGQPVFIDTTAQKGSLFGAYLQDKWTPSSRFSLAAGLRYDRSTGYASGAQLSPRIEANLQIDKNDILHAYYGSVYGAPFLEDTRRAAVVTGAGVSNALPVYDLQPEHDSYYEFGLAHTFGPGARAYVNFWKKDVRNVLDTTQIYPTPVFAVFNNTIGIAKGVEARLDLRGRNGDSFFFSGSLGKSRAGGISGSTFLFPPTQAGDVTLNPEDHDQTFTATLGYTKRFGAQRAFFASLEPQYGTGYPVQFQNGNGRLPPHLTFDASVGREPKHGALGFSASFENFTNRAYLIKVNNGFNSTQWGPGARFSLRITAPF